MRRTDRRGPDGTGKLDHRGGARRPRRSRPGSGSVVRPGADRGAGGREPVPALAEALQRGPARGRRGVPVARGAGRRDDHHRRRGGAGPRSGGPVRAPLRPSADRLRRHPAATGRWSWSRRSRACPGRSTSIATTASTGGRRRRRSAPWPSRAGTDRSAIDWLNLAGTSPDYAGLFATVERFEPPTTEELAERPGIDDLPERAELPDLVDAMVAIDGRWDRMKAIAAAGFRPAGRSPGPRPAARGADARRAVPRAASARRVEGPGG